MQRNGGVADAGGSVVGDGQHDRKLHVFSRGRGCAQCLRAAEVAGGRGKRAQRERKQYNGGNSQGCACGNHGIPPAVFSPKLKPDKNESRVETALGMGARKGLSSYPNTSYYDTRKAILNIRGIKGGLETD